MPAPDCALRADDCGRPHGLRQDDRHQLVSRRKDEGRQSRRHPHEHLLGKAAHALAQRAGCVPVRGAGCAQRLRFSDRRGCRNAGSGGALPRVFLRQDGVLSVPRRFSSAARRARRALHLPHQRAPARECAPDRCQPRPVPARGRDCPPGRKSAPDRHGAPAAQPHRACRLCPPLRRRAFRAAAGGASSVERGLVLGNLSEPARAFRARQAPRRKL